MTRRLTDRVRRDLQEIATTTSPSESAWEAIRHRIAAPGPDTDSEIIMLSDNHDSRTRRHRRWGAAAAAAAAAVVVVVAIFAWPSDDDQIDAAASPEERTIEAYLDAYNDREFDAVMALFGEDSELIGHPFGTGSGLDEISAIHRQDLSAASSTEPPYRFERIRVVDGVVTWDHRWVNSRGEVYCGSGHRAVVTDGTITRWEFADGELCEDQG